MVINNKKTTTFLVTQKRVQPLGTRWPVDPVDPGGFRLDELGVGHSTGPNVLAMSGGPWGVILWKISEKKHPEVFHRFKKNHGGWGGWVVLGFIYVLARMFFFWNEIFGWMIWVYFTFRGGVTSFAYCGWNDDEFLPQSRQNTWMGQFDSPPDTQSLYFYFFLQIWVRPFLVFQPMWFLTAAEALPVLTDADRIYDVEVCPVLSWLEWFCWFCRPSDTTGATWIQLDTNREQRETSGVAPSQDASGKWRFMGISY